MPEKTILIVDDEPHVQQVLRIRLESVGYRVEVANDGLEALAMIREAQPDLVILDIMGVRGFELLDAAVKHKLPVAMLTAHALTPEALKRSIEMMARVYLPKEKMGEIVPFLEYVLKYEYLTGWNVLFKKLKGFFNERWGKDWQKADAGFWKEFNMKLLNC